MGTPLPQGFLDGPLRPAGGCEYQCCLSDRAEKTSKEVFSTRSQPSLLSRLGDSVGTFHGLSVFSITSLFREELG